MIDWISFTYKFSVKKSAWKCSAVFEFFIGLDFAVVKFSGTDELFPAQENGYVIFGCGLIERIA